MQHELIELIENLAWFNRRQALDHPMTQLMVSWEARFKAQSIFFVRRGMPELLALKESAERNAIERALTVLGSFQFKAADKALDSGVSIAFKAGGAQSAVDIGASYLTGDGAVLAYLKNHGAEQLAADVDEATKKLVRARLVQSFAEKWTYNRTVKEIRALWSGFSERARQGHIRNRAELIAVHELGNAYSAGALYVGRELKAGGLKIEKGWALASGPCALCLGNAAQGWIEIDKHFASGHLAPCGHPACRCSLITRSVQ